MNLLIRFQILLLLILMLENFTMCLQHRILDYYVNLIEQETNKTLSYVPPKDLSEYKVKTSKTIVYGHYDYVIVGAGSTGSVLANRLSEIESNNVLLLEAGGPETNFSDIPGMSLYLQRTHFNWNYNTTPQTTSCLGMFNLECTYPRGKGLGGSSIINALVYTRGNKEDYNAWYRQGNPGWSFQDVLPYFIKSENFKFNGDKGYHGVGGNMNVEFRKTDHPQAKSFFEANLELGRSFVDYNGKQQLGISKTQFNTVNGRRDSAGKAFLLPAMRRSNLKVLTNSLVTKILISKRTKAAHGVLFSLNGQLFKAKSRREVIVSAGAIASPQLLMLSGIGPKAHLKKMGIPVIKSLDVGRNFQDHPGYYALFVETNYTEPIRTLEQNVEDFLNNKGPFVSSMNSYGLGFYRTKLANGTEVPDIEIVVVTSNSSSSLLQKSLYYSDVTFDSIWRKINGSNAFALYVILLHPRSRGEIILKSNNPLEYPLIDSRFLSDPDDVDIETMYQGINLALDMIKTKAFKKLNATLAYAPLPACQKYRYLSKDYWYCQLRHLTSHVFHPVGTCKMGPDPNKGAVVNHELKVHGINKLRVADASIIPDITSGHTHAPCVMIGEKLADMIKSDSYFN